MRRLRIPCTVKLRVLTRRKIADSFYRVKDVAVMFSIETEKHLLHFLVVAR